jgi:hypothetical protein
MRPKKECDKVRVAHALLLCDKRSRSLTFHPALLIAASPQAQGYGFG